MCFFINEIHRSRFFRKIENESKRECRKEASACRQKVELNTEQTGDSTRVYSNELWIIV